MTRSLSRARSLALGAMVAGSGVVVFAGAASAHITIAETEVTAGSYEILTFGLPHGCGESAVTELRIQIPEETVAVTPTRNALWEVEKVMETLDEPLTGPHGETITERVAEVLYTAKTPLPNGYRDVFELSLLIPEETAGMTLYFPTVQTCEEGETAWIEIPAAGEDPHSLDAPSPSVNVVAADAADDHHHDDDDEATASGADVTSEGAAAADEVQETAAAVLAADDGGENGGTDALSVIALVVGGLGLGVGGLALFRGRSV